MAMRPGTRIALKVLLGVLRGTAIGALGGWFFAWLVSWAIPADVHAPIGFALQILGAGSGATFGFILLGSRAFRLVMESAETPKPAESPPLPREFSTNGHYTKQS